MQPLYRIKPDNERQNTFQASSLTLDVSRNHLALTVIDKELGIVDYLDYFELNTLESARINSQLAHLLNNHPFLKETFESTLVVFHSTDSLLLPQSHYKPQHRRKLLEWQTGDLEHFQEMAEELENNELVILSVFPTLEYELLQKLLPSAQFTHVHAATLKSYGKTEMPPGCHITLSVYSDLWICAAWQDGRLQVIRSYDRTTADDLCFLLIQICEALSWKPAHTSLEIGGMIHRNAAELTMLKRFFSQISLAERPTELLYDDGFFNHPAHFFSPLIQHTLCG